MRPGITRLLLVLWMCLGLCLPEASHARRRKIKARPAPENVSVMTETSGGDVNELEGEIGNQAGAGPEVFDRGVELFYQKNYVVAATFLWSYLSGNQPGAEKYEYAEYFLAQCLDKLQFSHAAMEYYFNVAKNRTRPELLPDALEAIERLSRNVPIDQDLILKDLIYDSTFGYLREDLQNFVEYTKGLLDYRNGLIKWGRRHFDSIRKSSYYYHKAEYVQAVYELVKHNLDEALTMLERILAADIDQTDVINTARQSMARLLFEKKQYKEAYEMYELIDAPIEKQASVFLEEAWTQYHLKSYRRAMGLLYALEAPAFYRYFDPEKYLIKALIYQNLCHYNVAKDAVADFRSEYGEAVAAVYDRVDLSQNEIILDAALQDPLLMELERFQKQLNTELGQLADFAAWWGNNRLMEQLKRIYDLKISEVNRAIRTKLEQAIRVVAEKLLDYEEQMNILEYEVGLSIYKRIRGTPSKREVDIKTIPYSDDRIYYEFDGEFWSDELHDLRFFIEDRCFGEERWE